MSIFDINKNHDLKIEYLNDSPIFTIENFYKYPEKVYKHIFERPYYEGRARFWQFDQIPTYNGIYFEDRRFSENDERLIPIFLLLKKLVEKHSSYQYTFRSRVVVNFTSLKSDEKSLEFNNYIDNYWWPHIDKGFNGIVYFHDEWGTNLYSKNNTDERNNINDSFAPWRSKNHYHLLKKIKPKFNKLVIFDGGEFLHGMDVPNKKYFGKESRNNQIFFFKKEETQKSDQANIFRKIKNFLKRKIIKILKDW